ncbi:hypothetical protein BJY01DRAFT_253477 [Aspergillus pseudoustus]|uniref:Uncharacterized protein n=1 Tax=Aspergillus pseudoustus TaxID=1810923 RepID=A0ABR4J0E5_9EURO
MWDSNDDDSHYPPSAPRYAESGKFTYNDGGLRYDDVPRAREEDLKREVRRRKRHYTKPWAIAQLSLYGIDHKKSDSAASIQKVFESAVKGGRCKSPTAELQAFEAGLAEQYRRQLLEHAETVKRWEQRQFAQMLSAADEARYNTDLFLAKYFLTSSGQPDKTKQKEALILDDLAPYDLVDKVSAIPGLACRTTRYVTLVGWAESITPAALDVAFAKLDSSIRKRYKIDLPTEEGEMDLDRFMAKYFWCSCTNRVPDQAKTPEPLKFKLSSFRKDDLEAKLRAAVDMTPGLHFEYASGWSGTMELGGPTEYMVVGWGAEKVNSLVRALEAQRRTMQAEEEAQEKKRQEEEEAEFWRPHTAFMATYRSTSGPLTLDDLKGSYMVRCDKLSEKYNCQNMRIEIQPPTNPLGVVAAFDFDILSGTMLLSLSEDSLHAFAEELSVDPDSEPDSGVDDWSEPTQKRKRTGDDGNNPNRIIRRRLGEAPKPNRVYFRWAGASVPENELDGPMDELDDRGYLDFSPDNKAVAYGVWIYLTFFGRDEKINMSVHKIANEPSEEPRNKWSDYQDPKYYDIYPKWK